MKSGILKIIIMATKIFFGKFSNAKKISYAVSIGNAKLENIEKKYFLEINELLEKFSFISVRDSSTCEFVKKLQGKVPL